MIHKSKKARFRGLFYITLTALAIPAIEAGQATIHDDGGFGVAFVAELRTRWKAFFVLWLVGVFFEVFGFLFLDQFFLVLVQAGFFQHADLVEVLLQHFADFSHQAGDEFAAFFEVAAAGFKHAA